MTAKIGIFGTMACLCLSIISHANTYGNDAAIFATRDCGSLENPYGPFDYSDPLDFANKLGIVENFHFNAEVASLTRGINDQLPGGDLDYTLRAFPNHYHALNSMGRYALRYPEKAIPPGAHYSGECYFQRAIRFRPEDAVVRLVYAIYLSKTKRVDQAIEQLKTGQKLDESNSEVHYNLGLMYEKSGEHRLAVQHAKRAYELGYPLQGLRKLLERKGLWDDTPSSLQSSGSSD